jgi:serine/threonine protein kinase
MDHPNIAKVFDAGATQTGRPYFVMELVRGIPITEYCDRKKLSTRERLELFIPVCQAIQHAHQKGIIHRDIKPSNVLVALFDGRPVPMVIDFGVAKATHQKLTEKTLFTQFAQMIGTPAYMSPEQAEGSQLDIDTRSDIYSLGVLLYELMTGTTPFSEKRLRGLGYAEMQRVIAEEEPPRPSTRLSTLTDRERTELGQRRGEDARTITLLFRHELDWVVMKAIEKDRARRYETANGLAMDVKRYLEGRAVEAAPPSWGYQFYKLARKHKGTFAAAAIVMLVLAGAATFSTWQAIRATKAERLAEERMEEILREKATTDAVNRWMKEDVLALVSTWETGGGPERKADILLRDALIEAADKLSIRFPDQPLIEADLRRAIAVSLQQAGEAFHASVPNSKRVYELLREHLGPDHRDTIHAQGVYAWQLAWQGLRGDHRKRTVGPEALRLLQDSYHAAVRVGENDMSAWLANSIGLAHLNQDTGETSEHLGPAAHWLPLSASLYGPLPTPENATVADEHLISAHNTVAWLLNRQGAFAEASQLLLQISRIENKIRMGPTGAPQPDPRFARLQPSIAMIERQWQRNDPAAEQLLTNALVMVRKTVGSAHPADNVIHSLYRFYIDQDRFDDARELAQVELASSVKQLGIGHRFSKALSDMAIATFSIQGDWQGALDEFERQEAARLRDGNENDWPYRALTLRLLGRDEESLKARWAFWRGFRANPAQFDGTQAPSTALILLSLPVEVDELSYLLELAELGARNVDSNLWRRPLGALLTGMRAYRNGDHERAAQILASPAHSFPWLPDQPLASYFLAMAQYRLGRHEESRQTLNQANRWLDGLARRGKLVPVTFGATRRGKMHGISFSEPEVAILFALRRESEELIHRGTMSPVVTPRTMEENRRQWTSIARLLGEADWMARQRKYSEAAGLYAEARQQPGYSLEAADFDRDAFWNMLFAHGLLGELAEVESLIRKAFPDERYVAPAILAFILQSTNQLTGNLRATVDRAMAAWGLEKRWERGDPLPAWWDRLALGLYWYRQGEVRKAIGPLDTLASEPFVHFSATAKAYLALAHHQSGDRNTAVQFYKAAREVYIKSYMEPYPDLYQPFWVWAAMVEQAVREAGQALDADPQPTKMIQGRPPDVGL